MYILSFLNENRKITATGTENLLKLLETLHLRLLRDIERLLGSYRSSAYIFECWQRAS